MPLVYYLWRCDSFSPQDYRNEVGEILVADKQLAEEIEFDLKMLEEEQKKAAAAKATAAAVSTPQAATPHAQMVSSYRHTQPILSYSFEMMSCICNKIIHFSVVGFVLKLWWDDKMCALKKSTMGMLCTHAIDSTTSWTLHPQISPLLSPRVLGSPAVTATVSATPPKLRVLASQTLQKTPLSLLKGKSKLSH